MFDSCKLFTQDIKIDSKKINDHQQNMYVVLNIQS